MIKIRKQFKDGRNLVGLVFPHPLSEYLHDTISAIQRYAAQTGRWRFDIRQGSPILKTADIEDWNGDGIITALLDNDFEKCIKKIDVPVVSLSNASDVSPYPLVVNDDVACGRLGAEYLLNLNYSSFAFVQFGDANFCRQRRAGFIERLGESRQGCTVHTIPPAEAAKIEERLSGVVRSLKPPVAVMASTDRVAVWLLDICRRMELCVPGDIAVLGVNNFRLLCDMIMPTLSSIEPDGERIGLEAAQMLNQLMQGEVPSHRILRIPPVGVVERDSTNIHYSGDSSVQQAIQYIRAHAHEPVTAGEVAHIVPVSRRTLETRFRKVTGHTIGDEIRIAHVECAKKLLLKTNWKMNRIAAHSGFAGANRLHESFNSLVGTTPENFRRRNRQRR